MERRVKTYILLLTVIILSLLLLIFGKIFSKNGTKAVISVNGEIIKELPLDIDTEFEVKSENGDINIIEIGNGYCYVKSANCPDKLCINQGEISKAGESIICLPHKVVVTIEGNGNIDSMVR
ncbi:NusG domain II-containing protein [Butyrivibrio sp. AE3004]|uniref:NusG domain II-containing protein n=1 Tax=Butyrivibrio sp. AE3004 TaxID=1506994 RepID=UPI00049439A5|nr:NusG domain II-containing protein [Butyrivibrio sp. AE3004]